MSRVWLIFYFLVSTHLPLEFSHTGFLSAGKRPPFLGSSALARFLYRRLSSHLSGVRSNVTSTVCGYLNDLTPSQPHYPISFLRVLLGATSSLLVGYIYLLAVACATHFELWSCRFLKGEELVSAVHFLIPCTLSASGVSRCSIKVFSKTEWIKVYKWKTNNIDALICVLGFFWDVFRLMLWM